MLTMDDVVFLDVRVALGGYEAVTNLMLPGKLLKHIKPKQIVDGGESGC